MSDSANLPIDHKARYRQRLLEIPQGGLVDMYMNLLDQLAYPPEGWSTFGSHLDHKGPLIFWGSGEDGMPLWERPA